jgi:hypothetical protein
LEKINEEKLHNSYSSSNIIRFFNGRGMYHLPRGEMVNACKTLVRKPEWKITTSET